MNAYFGADRLTAHSPVTTQTMVNVARCTTASDDMPMSQGDDLDGARGIVWWMLLPGLAIIAALWVFA